ncbi:hypothetical protein [Paucilactobacillus nenjiangensis]|uniref:Uncharacterized protein n=1 Tax=Paucilactobacillus nenjiangensis TaxID=1296540 RepID=A0A5P1WY13_9LACO|nr:hypothetical protein [Paucilactobacillus nenjiangensis]QER66542.1 hypothetical protein F0161_00760 [Paucilactobacillus nenjiangensis]
MSNREIATVIWIIIFVIILLIVERKSDTLSVIVDSFVNLLNQPVLTFIIIYQLLVLSIVSFIIYSIDGNWWLLKDYLLTVMVSGFYIKSKYKTNNLLQLLIGTIGISSIYTFLANKFVFSLPIELILIPIISFLTLVSVVAKSESIISVVKFVDFFFSIIGIIIVLHIVISIFIEYKHLAHVSEDFFLLFENVIFYAMNIPIIKMLFPLTEFDVIDNFTTTKKTRKRLAWQIFCRYTTFIWILYGKRNLLENGVVSLRTGGIIGRVFTLTINDDIPKIKLKLIINMFIVGAENNIFFKDRKKKLPLKIRCIVNNQVVAVWMIKDYDSQFNFDLNDDKSNQPTGKIIFQESK